VPPLLVPLSPEVELSWACDADTERRQRASVESTLIEENSFDIGPPKTRKRATKRRFIP
jgi:hypothetical protein